MNTSLPVRSATRLRGFTLVELLVTMAIVAILAAIAYPSYRNHVVKTQRNAAKACLAQYAQFMERYYTTRLTYVDAEPELACAIESGMDRNYVFSVDDLDASTYTALATPTEAFAEDDPVCGTLSINQAGERSAGSGSAEDIAHCW